MTPYARDHATPPTPNAGEWIEWTGGENPAGEALVEVEYRDGNGETHMTADELRWDHVCNDDDIIAYRLATPSPAAQDEWEAPAVPAPTPELLRLKKRLEDNDAAAQADPAKGLEVVGFEYELLDMLTGASDTTMSAKLPDLKKYDRLLSARSLTDHATATRQIAERDARAAELDQEVRITHAFVRARVREKDAQIAAAEARALAAEADAARVRECLLTVRDYVTDAIQNADDPNISVGLSMRQMLADDLARIDAALAKDTPQ